MKIDDELRFSVFREHTASVPTELKATGKGVLVTDQSTSDAQYTTSLPGDQVGWVFWKENSRTIGAWGQIIPCVATDEEGSILPIASQALGGDSTFAAKSIVTIAAVNDHTKVMSVTGGLPSPGDIGFVVQTVGQDTFEQLWFPASSTAIKCDNVTPTTHSTKIYGVLAGGAINPANIGQTDDFLYIESNQACIDADSIIRQDAAKKGPWKLDTSNFPSLSVPDETPYTVETKGAFDPSSGKWRWYTQIGADGVATVYARVHWDYDALGDMSEAEIVTYDSATNEWASTGAVIWIEQARSKTARFETAGDATFFEVRLIQRDFNRREIVRDLYGVVRCTLDGGKRITHLNTLAKMGTIGLYGYLASEDLFSIPWEAPVSSRIQTTIGGTAKDNIMFARVPEEWDLTSGENYAWLETSDFSRGMPAYFRPIRPALDTSEAPQYASVEQVAGVTIARYRRKT